MRRISEIADVVVASDDMGPGVLTADLVERFQGLVNVQMLTDECPEGDLNPHALSGTSTSS